MRVADYVANFIYDLGIDTVFSGMGRGMLYLSDGIAQHGKLKLVVCHHEQAAAYAAVGYAKQNGHGACVVTSGCGSTNTMTGVLDAWQDSIPVLFISGQVPVDQTMRATGYPVRQLGVQEVDMVALVESIVKYSAMVMRPSAIAYHLEKAAYIARNGRPGPVWLEVPQDIQQAEIDLDTLTHFQPEPENVTPESENIEYVRGLLEKAERPVLIAGGGVRLAGAVEALDRFLFNYVLPVVTPFMGVDLLAADNPLYLGRIGYKGNHAANVAVENADLVIAVGTRLSLPATSFLGEKFAPHARLVVVDIDPVEHWKAGARIDRLIAADAGLFFHAVSNRLGFPPDDGWLAQCTEWKEKWPVGTEGVYGFLAALSEALPNDATVICDAGSTFYAVGRGYPVKKGQRVILSGAQTDMGFALPGAVGVCFARGKRQTIAIQGDGSFQFNLQELQTVKHHNLPIVLFVWNNDGYLSIRASQNKSCEGRHIGTDDTCGISFPDLQWIAFAYGIPYHRITEGMDVERAIRNALAMTGPVIVEVMCERDQDMCPKEKGDATEIGSPTRLDAQVSPGDGREVGEGDA